MQHNPGGFTVEVTATADVIPANTTTTDPQEDDR